MKLALVQMNVQSDKAANLALAERLIGEAVLKEHPRWLALPEMFDFAGGSSEDKRRNAEILGKGAAYACARALAKRHRLYLHAGSFHELVRHGSSSEGGWREEAQRISNTSVVFDPSGEAIAVYRKLHLFDITAPDGAAYRESANIEAGREIVTYDCEGFVFGCAICYDLRFPELFQALRLKGAEIIALPSAFTRQTGKDHWEVLLRARAIETQCYFAAPAQTGAFMQGGEQRFTFGHSLIVNPWGQVMASLEEGNGFIAAEIDKDVIKRVRANMPVMEHRRFSGPEIRGQKTEDRRQKI